MKRALTFDDVLIVPKFTEISSRGDTSPYVGVGHHAVSRLPILSANMDTVTGPLMAQTLAKNQATGALHRFCSIEENVENYLASEDDSVFVSIGVGGKEMERAQALYRAGARNFIIDVAHGANLSVVEQTKRIKATLPSIYLAVGNFATNEAIVAFESRLDSWHRPDAYKVGIGGGSMCTTRIKTGCGVPTLQSVIDCAKPGRTIIADGGIRTPGDVVKALAAGAKMVMIGGMFAGTFETPGEVVSKIDRDYKIYRGSASADSYKAQGKTSKYITAEGEATMVPYKGYVEYVIRDIEGGLRSAMTYVDVAHLDNGSNRTALSEAAELIEITSAGQTESRAHGK